jgi:GntR family transcriptional regulator / MocR family aminotransferase
MTAFPSRTQLRGVSTLVAVDQRLRKSMSSQIYDAFSTRIANTELRPGQLVPSSRELAHELGISRLPVLTAYAQLLAEGYFEARIGSGTFISRSLHPRSLPRGHGSQDRVNYLDSPSRPRLISARASALPQYQRPYWAETVGPFRVGQPDLSDFPLKTWARLAARRSRNLRANELLYGDPMGFLALREAVATYLRTSRAVKCEVDQIMIVSGSQQALDLTTRVLLDPGVPVWVEEPGYWLAKKVLGVAGCRVIPVPVDSEGLDVRAGTKLSPKARAAFVVPSHQFPLGVTMSATRRFQLLDWAHKTGSWIIEDDYDSEYRYGTMPISSLQGLDTQSRVIYVGTFSKVLFPSLRVGYIVIPSDLVGPFTAVRQSMDLCPSMSNQAVLADFIRHGHFARHLRRMRRIYAERREVLAREITRELGSSCTIVGGEAGMQLTLLIDANIQDRDIAGKAAERKFWLWPLSMTYEGSTSRQGFILGYGNTRTADIPNAVSVLKRLLNTRLSSGNL